MYSRNNEYDGDRKLLHKGGHAMPLNVALVGLGKVAEAHLAAYCESAEIKVIAAVEPVERRLAELAGRFKFRGYTDLASMLREQKPDVACVLTPVNLHRQIVEDCAAAGVNVLCEKPIAIALDDAERMVSACAHHGVKLCYGSSYRHLPAVVKARELIASGALGDILLMSESAVGGQGSANHASIGNEHYPQGGPGGSGMGLVDHGIHLIDIFPWLADSEIISVMGRGNISACAPVTEYAHMNLANGAAIQLLYNDSTYGSELPAEGIMSHGAAWNVDGYAQANTWHKHPGSLHIYGSRGTLRVFHYGNQVYLRDSSGFRAIPVTIKAPPAQFALQMESFARAIKADKAPAVTGEDGVRALRVLLAIYRSAEKGQLIKVETQEGSTPDS